MCVVLRQLKAIYVDQYFHYPAVFWHFSLYIIYILPKRSDDTLSFAKNTLSARGKTKKKHAWRSISDLHISQMWKKDQYESLGITFFFLIATFKSFRHFFRIFCWNWEKVHFSTVRFHIFLTKQKLEKCSLLGQFSNKLVDIW